MHLWSNEITTEDFKDIETFKEIGYDGIEIFLAEPEKTQIKELGAFLKSIDMGCLAALGLGPDQNPISEDANVRQAGLDAIKRAIDALHEVGGTNICGPFHSAFATFSRNSPQEYEYERSAEVLREAAEYAAQANITLTPEALNRFECYLVNTMEQLRKLVEMVDHPSLSAMFDPFHANIEEKSFSSAIETIAPVLSYVHISENDRGTPGSGIIAWDEVFSSLSKISYDGWMSIEAFSRYNTDFANAINVWREYEPRMDITRDGFAFVQKMLAKHFSTTHA